MRKLRFVYKSRIFRGLGSGILFVAIWQVLMGKVYVKSSLLLPPPSEILEEAIFVARTGDLLWNTLMSLERVALGFGIGFAIAIPLGIAIGRFRILSDTLEPILEMIRPIPPLAWIPISILWFGIGNSQNVFIIFIAAFFCTLVNTVAGVRSVDTYLVWSALNLGCPKSKILWKIVLPSVLPSILTGARVGLGASWMCLVAAELVAASSGLGFMIMDARQLLLSQRVLVGMLTIGLLGFLMDQGVRYIEQKTVGWFYRGRVT
jgi:ABC-type nitrate/sulfonate/bicarbonate transport system permease component